MNPHDFYTLLEGHVERFSMKNGVWEYPQDFIDRYNASVECLNNLATQVRKQITIMDTLEKEQMKYTAGNQTKGEK